MDPEEAPQQDLWPLLQVWLDYCLTTLNIPYAGSLSNGWSVANLL